MTKNRAWVSRAFMDTLLVRYATAEGYFDDIHFIADTIRRNQRGEPMPAERFPKELYGKYTGKGLKKFPDLCEAMGFWLATARLADVLRQFDLGRTSLYPTKVFQIDRKTPLEGDYLCINFGETKASFLPEESPRAMRVYPGRDIWALNFAPKDDDIALSEAALEGPDLWLEEPRLTMAFFMSDRLVSALRAAKLSRYFGLRRCRIVAYPHALN